MNWSKRIDRRPLLKSLGLPEKLSQNYEGLFNNVCIRNSRHEIVESCADIRIARSNGRRHRIFILCKLCCRDIPVGRYHQHYACKRCACCAQ